MSKLRKRLLLSGLLLLAIAAIVFFRRDIATHYIARKVTTASNAEEELQACRQMNRWSQGWTYGYSVRAFDAKGVEIRPWETGDYVPLHEILITWFDGTTARRRIINPDSVTYICGE